MASERFVRERALGARAVEIVGQATATDFQSTFSSGDIEMVGADLTRAAARCVYEQSDLGPESVDVIELHGATGLAQCAELTWQLRTEAGARQVEGARVGLQHDVGFGGAAVVTPYREEAARPRSS